MRKCIVTGDKLIIRQFKNVYWKKETGKEKLPDKLSNAECINENIARNGCWYCFDNALYVIYVFLANIGKDPHPLIEMSSVSVWYSSNLGGVYLVGMDKKTGAFFAPVVN